MENINVLQKQLVQALRDRSHEQVEFWRQVPYLALQADGRTGHLDQYSCAFYHGYWQLHSSEHSGYYHVYVDLETGDLVSASNVEQLASDDAVLNLNADELDAEKLVAELIEEGKEEHGSYYSAEAKEEWRQSVIAETGLTPIYSRGGSRKKIPFVWD